MAYPVLNAGSFEMAADQSFDDMRGAPRPATRGPGGLFRQFPGARAEGAVAGGSLSVGTVSDWARRLHLCSDGGLSGRRDDRGRAGGPRAARGIHVQPPALRGAAAVALQRLARDAHRATAVRGRTRATLEPAAPEGAGHQHDDVAAVRVRVPPVWAVHRGICGGRRVPLVAAGVRQRADFRRHGRRHVGRRYGRRACGLCLWPSPCSSSP